MIVKTKKVYYCEFCGRHRLRPVTDHERVCTKNPRRNCGLCERTDISELLTKYRGRAVGREIKAKIGYTLEIDWPKGKFTIQDIQDDVDGCPVCTLAILRLCDFCKWPLGEELKFDYKAELEKWWEIKNREAAEAEMQSMMY